MTELEKKLTNERLMRIRTQHQRDTWREHAMRYQRELVAAKKELAETRRKLLMLGGVDKPTKEKI